MISAGASDASSVTEKLPDAWTALQVSWSLFTATVNLGGKEEVT